MNDFYNNDWYDARWNEMSPIMRAKAAHVIEGCISDEDMELIRRKYAEFGEHMWIHHLVDIPQDEQEMFAEVGFSREGQTTMSGHHIFGTQIRNRLRSAGLLDHDLPPAPYENGDNHQNWDDFYCQAIEAAAGLRDV